MESVDYETKDAAIAFMKESAKEGKPFFTWYNATTTHV
jgi:arylsulfatase